MRKICSVATIYLFFFNFLLTLPAFSARGVPALVIFKAGVDTQNQIADLKSSGVRVRQSVPPRVFIGEFPSLAALNSLSHVEKFYTSIVPMDEVTTLDGFSKSLIVNWNRNFSTEKPFHPMVSVSGLSKQQISNAALPAPTGIQIRQEDSALEVSFEAVFGALAYETQLSKQADFSSIFAQHRTDKKKFLLALPTPSSHKIFVRVRAMDRPDIENATGDLFGRWSQIIEVSPQAFQQTNRPAPQLTSPLNGYTSTGFTVILEWTDSGPTSQIQIAKSKNFSTTLCDTVVSGDEYNPSSSVFHLNEDLYWRVRTWGNQTSPWSEIRHLTIEEPRSEAPDAMINPEAPQ